MYDLKEHCLLQVVVFLSIVKFNRWDTLPLIINKIQKICWQTLMLMWIILRMCLLVIVNFDIKGCNSYLGWYLLMFGVLVTYYLRLKQAENHHNYYIIGKIIILANNERKSHIKIDEIEYLFCVITWVILLI